MSGRSRQRTEWLANVLCDGLSYSWFECSEYDAEACTATVRVMVDGDTDDAITDDDGVVWRTFHLTADDVARGIRMYGEVLDGHREPFPGAWRYRADDAVRAGIIASADEFVPTVHGRARAESYARQLILADRTNGDAGDYDADTADNVIQLATLGAMVYG